MEVGEYIRTKDGFIRKVGEIDRCQECNEKIYISVDIIDGLRFERSWHLKEIVSHSKNIIDLIEKGDYVNGYLVLDKDLEGEMICLLMPFNEENQSKFNVVWNTKYFIKSILTHEQYEQNCYKVGEENE